MSVIAAIEYPARGTRPAGVYVGADSFIGDAMSGDRLRNGGKFFLRHGRRLLVGCTGSYRVTQLASGAVLPVQEAWQSTDDYLCGPLARALRLAVNADRGVRRADWAMILAYRGRAYEVQRDWSIVSSQWPVCAIGCGAPVTGGALDALTPEGGWTRGTARAAMRAALRIAERRCPMVRGKMWYEDVV